MRKSVEGTEHAGDQQGGKRQAAAHVPKGLPGPAPSMRAASTRYADGLQGRPAAGAP